MSFRDETALLREKLLGLDEELARLEGTRRGLEVALAEAQESLRSSEAALAALPRASLAKRATASTLGWLLGTVGTLGLLAAACFLGVTTCDAVIGPELARHEGQVRRTTRADLGSAASCTVVVRELEDRKGHCALGIECGAQVLLDAEGACGTGDDRTARDAYLHTDALDVAVVPRLGVAVLREEAGITEIALR